MHGRLIERLEHDPAFRLRGEQLRDKGLTPNPALLANLHRLSANCSRGCTTTSAATIRRSARASRSLSRRSAHTLTLDTSGSSK
jgi:hypothetical protein